MALEAEGVSDNNALIASIHSYYQPMTRKKKSTLEASFDKDFLMMMVNSQLECWAASIVMGQKVKVLLFDSNWLPSVLRDFRREGWVVDIAYKAIQPPPRTYYYFSHPGFKDTVGIVPN